LTRRRSGSRGQAETAQGRVDRVLAHATGGGSDGGKEQFAAAGYGFQLAQDSDGSRRQWNPMRPAHFHSLGRYRPDARFKVEVRPFRRAKLARANKGKRKQFKRSPRLRRAPISRNGAKKAAKRLRLCNRRTVVDGGRGECALKRGRRVALGAARGHRESEDFPNGTTEAFSRFHAARPRASIGQRIARISGADMSAIGREPMPGRARLMNHSNFILDRALLF
jgi:hypothetical protein